MTDGLYDAKLVAMAIETEDETCSTRKQNHAHPSVSWRNGKGADHALNKMKTPPEVAFAIILDTPRTIDQETKINSSSAN